MNYENRLDYFENNYEIIFGANFNETLQLDDRTDNQELKKCRWGRLRKRKIKHVKPVAALAMA